MQTSESSLPTVHNRPTRVNGKSPKAGFLLVAVLIGMGSGILAVTVGSVPSKWAAVIVLALIAPTVALIVNDIRRLVLIALVVDIAFGVDVAVQNQGWHRGGPTGYLVSLMTIVLVVGYAVWIMERQPRVRFFPQITIPALLYLLTTALSLLQSPNLQLSGFGLFLRCQMFLMYFYLVNHVEDWANVDLIVTTAIICLLLESILMVLQYFTGFSLSVGGLIATDALAVGAGGTGVTGARVSGTLGTPGSAALYLNSMALLAFGVFLSGTLAVKRLGLAAFGLGIVALVTTSSRGGWLAFGVALAIVVGRLLWTPKGGKAVLALLIGVLLIGSLLGQQIWDRLRTMSDDKTRQQLDTMAYNIIRDHPLGVGENTYELFMKDRYAHPAMVGHRHLPVHNRYLMIWAETGIQGLIAFVLLLIAPIVQARRWLFAKGPPSHLVILGITILGGLVTFMVHMRSESFNARPQDQLLWFLIAALVITNRLIDRARVATASASS